MDSRSDEVRNKFSLNMFEDEINLQLKFFPEDRKELLKITRGDYESWREMRAHFCNTESNSCK